MRRGIALKSFAAALCVTSAGAPAVVPIQAPEDGPPFEIPGLSSRGPNARGFPEYAHEKSGIVLVLLPAGEYERGSPPDETGRGSDETLHRVKISKPFLIGKTEVTNAQIRRFQPDRPGGVYRNPKTKKNHEYGGDDQPAVNLSWESTVAYCRWAGLRLPTEAEWEYAARGGDGRVFPWGNEWPCPRKSGNFEDAAARRVFDDPKRPAPIVSGYDDGFGVTAPVGSFAPNSFGLFDLAGNASEWCFDWYAAYPDGSGVAIDPKGPETGRLRILRGSHFRSKSRADVRCAKRMSSPPTTGGVPSFGFRVAMDGAVRVEGTAVASRVR